VQSGGLTFENNGRVTEDETDGSAFKNPEGERIAVLDRKGDWNIKGRSQNNQHSTYSLYPSLKSSFHKLEPSHTFHRILPNMN
jgi:hypothetical protein